MFPTKLAVTISLLSSLVIACSSSNDAKPAAKKPASGRAAAPTTKKPSSTPAPQQKVSSTVGTNKGSASDMAQVCTEADEGKGACDKDSVVFCASESLFALDCATAFGGTCAEVEEGIDCVIPE